MNNKRRIVGVIALSLMMSLFGVWQLMAADEMLSWNKLDTMNTNLNVVDNKAGDDDVLLELNVAENGRYHLTYYLEDGQQTSMKIVQAYEALTLEYHIFENDGTGGSADVTQDRVSDAYLAIDYEMDVPDWQYDAEKMVGDSGGLEFSIERSASNEYPGIAIDVDNNQLLVKWDFANERLYVLIKDYEGGKIMPVALESPDGDTYKIKVLKGLEDFEVNPTHYYTSDGAFNIQLNPVALPNDASDTPGDRPGLDITFKQPMEMNELTWSYSYAATNLTNIKAIIGLEDVATKDYFDLSVPLQFNNDLLVGNLNETVNNGVVYGYDQDTYTYTVHLVQDKSDLADQDSFIQWAELAASSIYNVDLSMEVALTTNLYKDYDFTSYSPADGFGYTYMAYVLTRSNAEEAYLDITPFNVGEQDEVEYSILYSKIIKESLDTDEDLWLDYYHNSANDEIFIPVPFSSTSSQDAYQVVVKFSGVELYSQVLNYKATEDKNVPPTTPTIKLVDNLFVVPSIEGDLDNPEVVKFDLAWTAPSNEEVKELDTIFEDLDGIDNDRLYYEVSVNDLPTDKADNPFEVIKVFVVTKEDDDYLIGLYEPDDGSGQASTTVNYLDGYNAIDDMFRMDDLIVRQNDRWSNVLTSVIDDAANPDTYDVTDTGEEADISFPGVNYIRIKAITLKDGEIATSSLSVPTSVSLSMQVYEVPTVDVLGYEPILGALEDKIQGITLQWEAVDMGAFESYMLEPLDKVIEDMWYAVYLSEDKNALIDLADSKGIPMTSDTLVTLDSEGLSALRSKDVLNFDLFVEPDDLGSYDIDIEGLDANQTYYAKIIVRLKVVDEVDAGGGSLEKASQPSNVLSITSPTSPQGPNDDEIIPLAPEEVIATFLDDNEINGRLEWVMPEEMTFEDDSYGFEVFSSVDRSLPLDMRGIELSLTDILDHEVFNGDVIEGWRFYVHEGITYAKRYNPSTNAYVDIEASLFSVEENTFALSDTNNAPNRVNYYYVRSIKITDESTIAASVWVPTTLTTSPVKGPINLIVDYTSDYTYEAMNETVIRFDAPITDESLVDQDYIMEIHVVGEEDSDYSTTAYPATYLGSQGEVVDGYIRISYLITGLKSGSAYDIKVRIEDQTQEVETLPNGSTQYPKSSFSEVVTTRTDFDQEAYDKNNKYEEYLTYYRKKAEELKLIEYFTIKDDSEETSIKYRESYLTGLIQKNRNSEFDLHSESKAINTYYIPSASLELLNDYDVSMVVETLTHLAGIRPNTLGAVITDEINDMIDDIENYDGDDVDYYLKMRVYSDVYNGSINGSQPSSEVVEIAFSVVGTTIDEDVMDDRMVDILDTIITANESSVLSAIEEDLDKGIDDNTLLDIVEEVLDDVRAEYIGLASIVFKGYLSDNTMAIKTINEPIYIGLSPDEPMKVHDVYTKTSSGWVYADSSFYNNRYLVDTLTLAPYVTVAQGNDDLTDFYGQNAVNMINTYNLSSIFSDFDLSHPSEGVDKYQWVSALARLLEARPGEDTAAYLESKGIDVDQTNGYIKVKRDEALYMYAQAYAYRHNIQLNNTYITDYYQISDLDEVGDVYASVLLRAANLGILQVTSGELMPKEDLDMADAMELLTVLSEGIY